MAVFLGRDLLRGRSPADPPIAPALQPSPTRRQAGMLGSRLYRFGGRNGTEPADTKRTSEAYAPANLPLPTKVTLDPSCADFRGAHDALVQAKALHELGVASRNSISGTQERAFFYSDPWLRARPAITDTFTSRFHDKMTDDDIQRRMPSALENLVRGYYPKSVLVHTHPNRSPPSPLSDDDRNFGIPIIAIDRGGIMTCALPLGRKK